MVSKVKLCMLLFLLFCFIVPYQAKEEKVKLPDKYEKWIKEEVVYIISPKEREVFYELENDRDRDLFIEEFWKQRDPRPGTSRNEFKEEHFRRIEYANKVFGRDTPTKGWRTDRGRIYIILGKPYDVQRFDSPLIYPVEAWYYSGNPALGQAANFRILFFKKHGAGDFEIYHPIADGPKSLLPLIEMHQLPDPTAADPLDDKAYEILQTEVSPELAQASWSSFPGQAGKHLRIPSAQLVGEVHSYSYKKVNDDYVYEFLEHKAVVEVDYSVNYITNQSQVKILQDPSGLFFVNYIVVPETFSVDLYQEKYFTDIKTSIRITDVEGKTIFQWGRDIPIELRKDELKLLEKSSFQLCDSFPLIPGNYTFHFLLENTVTKEFTSLEMDISVPVDESLLMSPLILARKINRDSPYSQSNRAFQVGNLQIYPSADNTFVAEDTLHLFFQVYGLDEGLKEDGQLVISFSSEDQSYRVINRNVSEYESDRDFLEEIPLDTFIPGIYTLNVSLFNREGEELISERERFFVSTKPLPASWVMAQTNPPADDPYYSHILGNQFLNKGDKQKSYDALQKAYEARPDSLDYALDYARTLLFFKKAQRVKDILLPFVEVKSENFGLYSYLGGASQELGEYEEAISYYQKALSHRGNVVEILNAIGTCYLQLGNTEQALDIWEKSLEIKPDQDWVRKKIGEIKKKI